MAVDQHKIIVELKRQLLDSKSEESREEVISQLADQLEQQQRFLKEAETCTQLLEDELSRTIEENEQLRSDLESSGDGEDMEKLESMVSDLTSESRDMLSTIAALEAENSQLKNALEEGESSSSDAQSSNPNDVDLDALKEKLNEAQQELLELQAQHIELEERYLELKMK